MSDIDPTANGPAASDDRETVVGSAPAGSGPLLEGPGTRIGSYRIIERIGEGGFGSVFMAEQDKPVQRKVALKIIKLGMDTRQVVARFEQERQTLAILDHPNIAKVFDAGATDTGRPFFVMELCTGERMDEYGDRHHLSIPDRLELFAQVCAAVQHAHSKGIIHRDIKPSNVLVSMQDGRAHAKVIDFGIAKATESKLTDRTLLTEHRQIIGTPEFMSPEQAEGSLDIDTRTDVYALGVMLYHLLTGTTPFTSKQLRSAAQEEILRIIREVDPPRPSTRLSQETASIATIAARRKTEPRKLGLIVRGDLDWIVLKAMEKDRSRRYETASGLAMDIRRYLAGEPVLAAPPSTAYRVRKFIRRHRGAVAASSLTVTLLILGVVGTSYGLVWAIRERDRATQEATRAKALNSFMQQMILAANPEESGNLEVTVAQMLLKASEKADATLRATPVAEGEARTFLADTLRAIGRVDEAEKEARRAVELRERGVERNTLHHAESLRTLAVVEDTRGDYRAAAANFQRALSILRSLDPPNPRELCKAHLELARALMKQGEFVEAEKVIDQGEAIVLRSLPQDKAIRADYLGVRTTLAMNQQGDLEKAESLGAQDVALRRALPDKHLLADALNSLAIVKMQQGDSAQALELYQEALDIQRREFGDTNQTVAITLENLANAYYSLKAYDQSMARLDEVLAIRIKLFGTDSFPVARTRFNTGVVASNMGNHARGLELIDGALTVFRKNLGENSVDVAQALRNRAVCLKGLGRSGEALRDARASLAILDAAVAPTERRRLRTLVDLTELLCMQGFPAEAEQLVKKTVALLDPNKADHSDWIEKLNGKLDACRAPALR